MQRGETVRGATGGDTLADGCSKARPSAAALAGAECSSLDRRVPQRVGASRKQSGRRPPQLQTELEYCGCHPRRNAPQGRAVAGAKPRGGGGQFILVTRFTEDWAKGGPRHCPSQTCIDLSSIRVLLVASSAGFPTGQGRSVTPAYPFMCASGAAYPVVKQRGLEVPRRSLCESEQLVYQSTKSGVSLSVSPSERPIFSHTTVSTHSPADSLAAAAAALAAVRARRAAARRLWAS